MPLYGVCSSCAARLFLRRAFWVTDVTATHRVGVGYAPKADLALLAN